MDWDKAQSHRGKIMNIELLYGFYIKYKVSCWKIKKKYLFLKIFYYIFV